jgi:hypothetical protein
MSDNVVHLKRSAQQREPLSASMLIWIILIELVVLALLLSQLFEWGGAQ